MIKRRPEPLSLEERAKRAPPPPWELVGALHDRVGEHERSAVQMTEADQRALDEEAAKAHIQELDRIWEKAVAEHMARKSKQPKGPL